jgi:hypothetical protein
LQLVLPDHRGSSLGVSVTWPQTYPLPLATQPVRLRDEDFPLTERGGTQLRGRLVSRRERLYSLSDELRGALGEYGRSLGEVRPLIYHHDETSKARVRPDPDGYEIAGSAHMLVRDVSISATLERGPRVATLTDSTRFDAFDP